ncbi:ATP-grasp superfamily enzyme [Halogeometricum borinquense DSM 11551]|uniref:ATP-grasp superfamily enzyme n=1 Tax=Halogeometricum borinquense (strain ATCC 700274 / DSM 11551 / JCM 10706 / KCTC 4070 / PR3) TaxID=469382 RepID=E4NL40_HALBP|nr:PAC2 family protein [Halogeometricum borinquense]ADQ67192.1 ATP-grasp superfamily enzyme [Halogeometricum borinquense DSM 11551]ELY29739.1 ATP-grasp superfamily enzyme [Halogeometricum borinquense DSM 11551]
MAKIAVLDDSVSLSEPTMVEGLPGVGLVGKIAADHLVEAFDMVHYGNLHCDGIPKVAVYHEGDPELSTPVRLYADAERDLLVLQSDVPIVPQAATEVANCLSSWFDDIESMPIFLSGLPQEKSEDVPALYAVAAGEGAAMVEEAGIDFPNEMGLISGPTGALLHDALKNDRTAVGLIVESDPQFPDPEASRVIIKKGIEPLAGIEVPVDNLVDRAEEIRNAKKQLAQRMQQGDEESTQAQPLRMYQ